MDHRHNRYAFLDGIRGMAAIFVLTLHTQDFWHIHFFRGYLAVDLFFILSGFVIAYAYDEKLKCDKISAPKFLLIRLIRLYPVYLLSLLLCSFILIETIWKHKLSVGYGETLNMIALGALFLPSQVAGSSYLFSINPPYWSLFFELITNAVYAISRPLLSNVVLASIVLISGICLTVVSFVHGNLDVGYAWGFWSLIAGFLRSVFGIFFGLLLFRHRLILSTALKGAKFISPWLAFFMIAAILASPSFEHYDKIIDVFSVVLIFPFSVLVAAQGETSRFQSLLLILGTASYPIYVLHEPVKNIFQYVLKDSVEIYAPVSGFALVVFLIVLSVLIEKWYDIPLRSWLSNKTLR
ncbi:acyltransferase [Sideroxydans sp. CL21]|uniref:acyltransferase family protein n=1 Tax=Sideroxydans sp. CL21 TaxID=2600596 RepID=UPI0024BC2041|nr:acyltransferase [Sideroxydans sp. CL21]